VVFRNPLPHIRGQEELRLPINSDEMGGHAYVCFFPRPFSSPQVGKSPTGC
jgi:hypothetical protein